VTLLLEIGRLSLPKMSKPTKLPRQQLAVLKLPEYRVPQLIIRARGIARAMTDNPFFPAPATSLATVEEAIDDLEAVETATLKQTALRDEKRRALVRLLQRLRDYVQSIADADPERAASIIESAGMFVKGPRPYPAPVFRAKHGTSGTILLFAPSAGDRAGYDWEYSLDGGETWNPLQSTRKASTKVPGLTPGMKVFFRYRPVTGAGPGNWSHPIAIIVT
jgi:hypothetical protein